MFGQIESLKTSFPNRINIDFIYQGVSFCMYKDTL